MARLILTFNKQVVKELPFDKGSLTLGRNPDNDIHVDNLAVSSYHARIDKAGSDFILTDLQSTNGTYGNDEKVVSRKLKHGDNIQVGKHVIIFLSSDKDMEAAEQMPGRIDVDKTMILDTPKQRELMAKARAQKGVPPPVEKLGVLSFLDGSSESEIELNKKLTRLGKSENCEIRLSGLMMAPTAATISKRPAGYTISFMGGMTKLKVNGKVVKDSVVLKDFDTIELGSYKFQFYNKTSQ
jgi:pSer/pThr/pTyr-binding forkhead associated (FHA) protein